MLFFATLIYPLLISDCLTLKLPNSRPLPTGGDKTPLPLGGARGGFLMSRYGKICIVNDF